MKSRLSRSRLLQRASGTSSGALCWSSAASLARTEISVAAWSTTVRATSPIGLKRFFAQSVSLGSLFKKSVDFFVGNYRQARAKTNDPDLLLLNKRMARALADPEYRKCLDEFMPAARNALLALSLWHGTPRKVH
jgi:hypothetical protein